MSYRSSQLSILLAASILTACGETERTPSFTERDSSGVRIIESVEPEWLRNDAWRLSETPTLQIGIEEGEEVYQLYRVTNALRLDNGAIVISNSGTSELRFFDAGGIFLRRAGRSGEGPGEFGELSSMRLWQSPNGTLVVWDSGNSRVNLFDSDGRFINSVRLAPLPETPRAFLWGVFRDGSWLAAAPEGGSALRGAPGEVIRSTFRYLRYASDGEPVGTLLQLQGRPRYVHRMGAVTHYPYLPFASEPSVLAHGRVLYVMRGTTAELEKRNLEGELSAIVHWRLIQRRRTRAIYDRYKHESLAEIGDAQQRQLYAHYYEQDLPLPEYVPAYESMVADAGGNIWLRRYQLPWGNQPRWDIISNSGRWLGTLDTPTGVEVFQIGEDFLLGCHRDDLGVERIRLYELLKP